MIAQETIQQLQYAPLTDRIQLIEALLQSLKQDIAVPELRKVVHKPFSVHTLVTIEQ